jgi:hypothetical protein
MWTILTSSSRIWEALTSIDSCRSLGNAFNSSDKVVYFVIDFPPQVLPGIVRNAYQQWVCFLCTIVCYRGTEIIDNEGLSTRLPPS